MFSQILFGLVITRNTFNYMSSLFTLDYKINTVDLLHN